MLSDLWNANEPSPLAKSNPVLITSIPTSILHKVKTQETTCSILDLFFATMNYSALSVIWEKNLNSASHLLKKRHAALERSERSLAVQSFFSEDQNYYYPGVAAMLLAETTHEKF
jgi:hypothetical protein